MRAILDTYLNNVEKAYYVTRLQYHKNCRVKSAEHSNSKKYIHTAFPPNIFLLNVCCG